MCAVFGLIVRNVRKAKSRSAAGMRRHCDPDPKLRGVDYEMRASLAYRRSRRCDVIGLGADDIYGAQESDEMSGAANEEPSIWETNGPRGRTAVR